MRKGSIHIGTSGWSYKHWKEIFYPHGLKATEWLSFLAESFDTTEINTSFYHLPQQQTVINWAAEVPKQFKFCPKISRYLTHMKKLHDPEEPLQRFFEVFDVIKDRLGPILVQLPAMVKFNPEVAEHFFKVLKKDYKEYTFALEVRHSSWLEQDAAELISKYNIGFVISQSGAGFPYSEMVTSDTVYVRFHGPGSLYASSYSAEQLTEFADKFRNWANEGRHVWAFFNNDVYGYAVANAKTLKEILNPGKKQEPIDLQLN